MTSRRSTPTPALDAPAGEADAEVCRPGEPFFDYLLLPYAPLRPAAGKLRPAALLAASFAHMGVGEEGRRLVAAARAGLGSSRTVWGIRREESGELSWELYFYRRDGGEGRGEPTLAGVLAALEGVLAAPEAPRMPPRWELLSLEFDAAGLRAGGARELDVYVGLRAYRAREGGLELKSLYSFDDPGLRLDQILGRLLLAVHAPRDGDEIARLLPPGLLDGCPRVCVANKRHADGLYFSHLRLDQMRSFLAVHRWPEEIREWVERHAGRLDHLLWDAGYDFRRAGPELEIPRSGLYGSF
jgi:hypothetical protein